MFESCQSNNCLAENSSYLEIKYLVDILVGREHIAHDDKVYLSATREFDAMKTIVATEQGIGIAAYVLGEHELQEKGVRRSIRHNTDEEFCA